MRVIRRAAAFAHTFVSLNYEQAAAIKDIVRSGPEPQASAGAVAHTGRGQQGGSMAKLVWLGAATMSVVAVTGAPGSANATPGMFEAARQLAAAVWVLPGYGLEAPLQRLSQWSEPGALLLLATSFFAAAVLVNRHTR